MSEKNDEDMQNKNDEDIQNKDDFIRYFENINNHSDKIPNSNFHNSIISHTVLLITFQNVFGSFFILEQISSHNCCLYFLSSILHFLLYLERKE
jgi:hypothetical protein